MALESKPQRAAAPSRDGPLGILVKRMGYRRISAIGDGSFFVIRTPNLNYVTFQALFHGRCIDGGFTLAFYKQILSRKACLQDLELVDHDFYQSLAFIRSVFVSSFLINSKARPPLFQFTRKPVSWQASAIL